MPREEVRKCFRDLDPGIDYVDFVVLFEEATGYAYDRVCRRVSLRYADPVLRRVAEELLLQPRATGAWGTAAPVLGQEGNPDFPHIIDIRYSVASLIFTSLNSGNSSLQRVCPAEEFGRLVGKLARGIPPSRRWLVCPPIPENAGLLRRYYEGHFEGFSADEYRYANIIEDDNIGWIATYGVDEGLQARESFEQAFRPFIRTLGLKGFSEYRLPLHLDPGYFADPVTPRAGVVDSSYIKRYASWMGVETRAVTFTAEGLRTLRLADLATSFVPVFAQVSSGETFEDRLFVAHEALIEVNNPARLCFSLPGPREIVLRGIEKGHVFETFVFRLLTGSEKVTVLTGTGHQPFPDGFLLGWNPEKTAGRLVQYSYGPPATGTGFRVAVEGPEGSPMSELARSLGKPRTELDLLLVQHTQPPHVLVGECKFAWEYNANYFRKGRLFAERASQAIRESRDIRKALGLPDELPVVPVLFASHCGPGIVGRRPSVMVTMLHTLSGRLQQLVASYLAQT